MKGKLSDAWGPDPRREAERKRDALIKEEKKQTALLTEQNAMMSRQAADAERERCRVRDAARTPEEKEANNAAGLTGFFILCFAIATYVASRLLSIDWSTSLGLGLLIVIASRMVGHSARDNLRSVVASGRVIVTMAAIGTVAFGALGALTIALSSSPNITLLNACGVGAILGAGFGVIIELFMLFSRGS